MTTTDDSPDDAASVLDAEEASKAPLTADELRPFFRDLPGEPGLLTYDLAVARWLIAGMMTQLRASKKRIEDQDLQIKRLLAQVEGPGDGPTDDS